MRKLALIAALSSVAFAPAVAQAADFMSPVVASPEMSMSSPARGWTGFYAGVFGGGAFNPATPGTIQIDQDLDGDFSEPLVPPLSTAFGPNFTGANDAGGVVGIEVGYDWQFDSVVAGVVADVAWVNYGDRQQAFSSTPASYSANRDLDFMGTVRARAGYLVLENLLAYAHGGVAFGDVRHSFVSTNPNFTTRGGGSNVGFQVGAGLETRVTDNISIGAEYAYTNFGESDFTARFTNAPFVVVNPAGSDLRGSDRTFDFHTVKASVKFRF